MATDRPRKLGIIAGSGLLPRLIASAAANEQNCKVFIVAFPGHTDPETVIGFEHSWERLGAAGSTIKKLHQNGITEIVFAGAIRRPSLGELRPDWYTTKFFARVGLKALGDDGFLKIIVDDLEKQNFKITGAANFIANCMAPVGTIGKETPTEAEWIDIKHGFATAKLLGQADVGQSVIVQEGLILAVEAVEGTSALIKRGAEWRRGGRGPLLIKTCKPQQDQRLDLPTIGLETIEAAREAGLRGIAVEAGKTILLNLSDLAEAADKAGLFLIGVDLEG